MCVGKRMALAVSRVVIHGGVGLRFRITVIGQFNEPTNYEGALRLSELNQLLTDRPLTFYLCRKIIWADIRGFYGKARDAVRVRHGGKWLDDRTTHGLMLHLNLFTWHRLIIRISYENGNARIIRTVSDDCRFTEFEPRIYVRKGSCLCMRSLSAEEQHGRDEEESKLFHIGTQ